MLLSSDEAGKLCLFFPPRLLREQNVANICSSKFATLQSQSYFAEVFILTGRGESTQEHAIESQSKLPAYQSWTTKVM